MHACRFRGPYFGPLRKNPPNTQKKKRAQKPASGSYEIFEDFRRAHKKGMQMSDQRLAPVLDLLGKLDPARSV